MQVATLAPRDNPIYQTPYFFCLGFSCLYTSVRKHRHSQITEQSFTMATRAVQMPAFFEVTHNLSSCFDKGSYSFFAPCQSSPSRFIPRLSPMLVRISLISLRDFRPKFLVLSISGSFFWTSSPMVLILAFFKQL